LAGFIASLISVIVGLGLSAFELRDASKSVALYPLLYPVGFAMFMSAVITTAWKLYFLKPLVWKGQEYTPGELKNHPHQRENQAYSNLRRNTIDAKIDY
jgi:hypothetical protein